MYDDGHLLVSEGLTCWNDLLEYTCRHKAKPLKKERELDLPEQGSARLQAADRADNSQGLGSTQGLGSENQT